MFYPNIAAERAKRRMSVETLAKELGVTRKTIYNWETSGHIPLHAIQRMTEIFSCTADYLLEHQDHVT